MATSGVTGFSRTARDIVTRAMRKAKILGSGGVPTAKELANGIEIINEYLKSLQMRGVALWRETNATVTIVANEVSGLLPPYIREVTSARLVVTATNERPLGKLVRQEYQDIPNKATQGTPSCYYVARQRDQVTLYVWPVPVATQSIKIDYDRECEIITDGSQNVDIPNEYIGTLVAVLSLKMADEFGSDISQLLVSEASSLEAAMLDADRPDSYFMEAC
jgi:hypothetical protein